MRTDPHPDEVRRLVDRVFGDFMAKNSGKRKGKGTSVRLANLPSPPFTQSEGRRAPPSPPAPLPLTGEGRFANRFRVYGGDEDEELVTEPQVAETMLIDEGCFVARTYRIEGYMAMWLISAGIVQFYDAEGRMLLTINLFRSLRPQRMAA